MRMKDGKTVPAELVKALAGDPEILTIWKNLRPSCQKEFAKYVSDAKLPETRIRRANSVLGQVAEHGQHHAKSKR